MSWANCSVKVSPHEPMGDTHDESEGGAEGRAAEAAVERAGWQPRRRRRPGRERAPGTAAEAAVSGRGRHGPAPPLAGASLVAGIGGDAARAGRGVVADDISGRQ